jgi:hypothetical protein
VSDEWGYLLFHATVTLLRDRILTRRGPADYTDLDWLYRDPAAL